jgi:integrase
VKAKDKRTLNDMFVRRIKPGDKLFNVYDAKAPGLVLRVYPSGRKTFAFVYNVRGRTRWFTIGSAIPLSDARRMATKLRTEVLVDRRDPASERKQDREAGTFAQLASRYVEEKAKPKNKSWKQAEALVKKHLLPRWGRQVAKMITRADVRAAIGAIESPSVANQVLAAASAIFRFGVKMEVVPSNPCTGIESNKAPSRERVLGDSELAQFWPHLTPPLRVLLLTGQRPGEVRNMRREHIKDNWWELPGPEIPALKWPGTKNKRNHRIWLPRAAREIIGEGDSGHVFSRADELDAVMRDICKKLGVTEKVTPHDLRRTHGSTITKLGFGRGAMNRIQNHKEGGIADVYDRHEYVAENQKIMEVVAEYILELAEGRRGTSKVVALFN